ncbi:hypothetical protein COX94_00090 [Candidatus Nomurabacteria bacterium CG_4_10_14_0_2_um_filter_33_9]|uniref:Uncharacterized protein n=1 Tax=Candidatus Nomurabacteria bacterium CG_4_10_14_0_2_um_filter_33_9 TaxID=1974728 RepID=A0A2J0MEV5_9BACT|nr:MAG: hypothetical protein COX94_00090 [Candidatus Nomurabacteria bacterium CG_4_10_14_0_2_um_filter_33_9]
MKKPFLHALTAALYIVFIVSIMSSLSSFMPKEDNIFMPIVMLSLFVLSAAVMGFLFLSEPLQLFLENQKKEAATFFIKTVGFFACFLIIFLVLIFLI